MHRTTSRRHRPRAYFVLAFHSGQSCGGGGRIRTYEGVSRQIYSLLPLAAWVPLREKEPRILISTAGSVNARSVPESGAALQPSPLAGGEIRRHRYRPETDPFEPAPLIAGRQPQPPHLA